MSAVMRWLRDNWELALLIVFSAILLGILLYAQTQIPQG